MHVKPLAKLVVLFCGFAGSAGSAGLCVAEDGAGASSHTARIELRATNAGAHRVVVVGLDRRLLAALENQPGAEALTQVLAVQVGDKPDDARPAMLGETRVAGGLLEFEPRFPFEPSVAYCAVLRVGGESPFVLTHGFTFDKPTAEPAVVTQVYPTGNVVPENLLKFYLHFSRPMSRGEAYRHVALLDGKDQPIELPFLELGEELWDPTGTRFTLFFDPGRIKRGLKPREEVGPALEEGKSYTLLVRAAWPDAEGQPLAREFRKSFRVTAPDDDQPRLADWRLTPPPANTRTPLEVRFSEPLDHALLLRVVRVVDASGTLIDGAIKVTAGETHWRFTPDQPWRSGNYRLVVETTLEDRAGNSLARPFEVDVTRPAQEIREAEVSSLPFEIRS